MTRIMHKLYMVRLAYHNVFIYMFAKAEKKLYRRMLVELHTTHNHRNQAAHTLKQEAAILKELSQRSTGSQIIFSFEAIKV